MKRVVHLLADFENHTPSSSDVARIRSEEYRLWVFHGPHQNKFDASLVKAWQPLGDRVDFVQSSKHGKNALDFHIAFKLGELNVNERAVKREASYVVISEDAGFDPLFDYMRTLGCTVTRVGTIPEALALDGSPAAAAEASIRFEPAPSLSARPSRGIIPAASTPRAAPRPAAAPPKKAAAEAAPALRKTIADGDVVTILTALQSNPKSRPGDRPALERFVVTRLGQKVTVKVARAVIHQLEQQKVVAFDGG